jgi:hypothetical protein
VEAAQVTSKLAFLVDGKTTREDVLLTLGVPSAQFEGEHILTYLLFADSRTKEMRVLPREVVANLADPRWMKTTSDLCNLVLVFGADGVLQRHSLVTGGDAVR